MCEPYKIVQKIEIVKLFVRDKMKKNETFTKYSDF